MYVVLSRSNIMIVEHESVFYVVSRVHAHVGIYHSVLYQNVDGMGQLRPSSVRKWIFGTLCAKPRSSVVCLFGGENN